MKPKKEKRIKGYTMTQILGAWKIYKTRETSICELCGGMEENMCNDKCPEYQRKYKGK